MPVVTLASLGARVDNAPQINQAISDLVAAGGGLLLLPDAAYGVNDEIVLPNTRGYGPPVIIRGSGQNATILTWLSDLGPGKWAVRPSNTSGTPGTRHRLENLSLNGPPSSYKLGVSPCQMDGVRTLSRFGMSHTTISGFRRGLDVIDDHQEYEDVNVQHCYYSLFADDSGGTGDVRFTECDLTGAVFAGLGISGTSQPSGWRFDGCHFGFAPWAVYAEAGTSPFALIDFSFTNCGFESCGAGGIFTNNRTIAGCLFNRVPIGFDNNFVLPGSTQDAPINLGSGWMSTCHVMYDGTFAAAYVGPQTKALIIAGGMNNIIWDDCRAALAVANAAKIPVARCPGTAGVEMRDGSRTMRLQRANLTPVAVGSLLGCWVYDQCIPWASAPYCYGGVAASGAWTAGDCVAVAEGLTDVVAGANGFGIFQSIGGTPGDMNRAGNVDPSGPRIGWAVQSAAAGTVGKAIIRPRP